MRRLIFVAMLMSVSAVSQTGCLRDFENFLARFESESKFQQEHIRYPLQYSYLDHDAEPEPRTITKRLGKAEIARRAEPLFPLPPARKDYGLTDKKITTASEYKRNVQLSKPDTGFQLNFQFERENGCWKLTAYSDLSM